MSDKCGYEDTTTGHPCQHPAESCPFGSHRDVAPDVGSKPGRPSKFNDDRARAAIEAARRGLSKAGCGRAAGVSHTTIARWEEKDPTFEDEDGNKHEFRAAFMRARNEGETTLVDGGLRDPEMNSQMARFLLATSFGYEKSERRKVDLDADHNIDAAEGVTAEFVTFSPDEDTDDVDE